MNVNCSYIFNICNYESVVEFSSIVACSKYGIFPLHLNQQADLPHHLRGWHERLKVLFGRMMMILSSSLPLLLPAADTATSISKTSVVVSDSCN